MSELLTQINTKLQEGCPALARLLSPLGRRTALPRGIPVQAAEARGKSYDGTIGLITDGHGRAMPLPTLAGTLPGLDAADLSRAFLYSPVAGIPEVRERWRSWQRRALSPEENARLPSSLPLVTDGLSHSLSLIADLFAGEGRPVAVTAPFWGNYTQGFATRTGARIVSAPAYVDGRFDPCAQEKALAAAGLADGEAALVIANFPSNPGGYSPTEGERQELAASFQRIADQRPLLVICDDAYQGLVHEAEISERSLFWDLIDQHPQLVPVKVDGTTKEFSFFGGRVGFLTFPISPDSPAAEALESKVGCLTRATVGSPVALSQMVLLQALRKDGIEQELDAVRDTLTERYRVLRDALEEVPTDLLQPLPFNAGCFVLVELPEASGVDAEELRLHLLEHHDTGLVSIGRRHLRIAYCSVDAAALPELVRRLARGAAELAAGGRQRAVGSG